MLEFAFAFLILISSRAFAGAADWEPVPPSDNNAWIAYRGSALEKASDGPRQSQVLRVTVKENHGGARLDATPRSVFGRLIFFEGSWDQLYERACQERPALEAMSRPED